MAVLRGGLEPPRTAYLLFAGVHGLFIPQTTICCNLAGDETPNRSRRADSYAGRSRFCITRCFVRHGFRDCVSPRVHHYTGEVGRVDALVAKPATGPDAAYGDGMPQSTAVSPGSPIASPREIRAGLLQAEAGDFDREYRRAMHEAVETMEITEVLALLVRWQRIADSSRDEPAHRRMLEHADRLSAGEPVATESWQVTRARLGL